MKNVFKHLLAFLLVFCTSWAIAQTELCNNGVDDDGDNLTDCSDSDCQYAANIEKGCNCADGIDNDGDGGADVSDADCAGFYGLTFVGEGDSDCSITPDQGSGTFDFVNPSYSGQNTVDTQSKIAVGDVNCDGIPDVVTTSKWNQTIRVVATSDNQADGSDKGDIIQDFKTPGSKIFPSGNFFFELEVLIADIDGSCPAEIFSIVSKRKNANSEPEGYYLVGFSANASPSNSGLVPLFDAIPLGPDRPGQITIADMDCDGGAEIVLKDQVYDAATGALLADGNVGDWNTEVVSAPVAVDIIEGGNLEVVVGNLILSYPDMTVIADMNALGGDQWFPKELFDANEYGFDNFSSTSVADMNGDGNLDIVLSGALDSKNGATAIFFWDVANGTVNSFTPPDPNYADGWIWGTSRPNLGDIDGDGSLEITFVAGNQLFALEVDPNTGALSQKWVRTINDSRSGIVATTVFDFDNDGSPEIVYRDSQQLVVIDGETGQNVLWSTACQSHTMTEGPIIADVDGDGATDLCTTCNTNTSFDIEDPIQQQALGELRCFYSQNSSWLPTRGVWNQSGYFVTNIADDLSVPCPRFDMETVFSEGPCDNGLPGPQRPFNTFLNQVPSIGPDGCPFYPSPDISFVGDDPGDPNVDPNDPDYFPAVVVIPPKCGDLGVEVLFNIINSGSLVISDNVDVSFWEGNPTVAVDPVTGEPATFLHADVLTLNNLQVGDTVTTAGVTFDYSGKPTTLYIILNDDGTEFPVDTTSGSGLQECKLDNNVFAIDIIPEPFTVEIENIADNFKCDDTAPDTGEIRAVVKRDGIEVSDYSLYGFQWYLGSDTTNAMPDPEGSSDWLTDLADGTYTVVVTNLEKGCSSLPVTDTVLRQGVDPVVNILINSHQTHCYPPNGELEVTIEGGLAGYSFAWYDNNLTPIGVTGPIASDLTEGEWIVDVIKSGCTERVSTTIGGPTEPDVVASVVQNVNNCANPGSGIVTAQAFINTVLQDSANYVFDWYFYNNATSTLGSILPPSTGSGPTRSGLDIGYYAVVATEIVSGCESSPLQIVQVTDNRTYPELVINEIAPQTSCDPNNPNGILEVVISNGGVVDDPLNYTIEWFRGQNTLPANLHANTSGTNGEVAEGIEGGGIPYTVKVTNTNNCFSTTDTIVTQDVNVPVLTLTKQDNTTCDPSLASAAYNGQITASVTFKGTPVTLPDPQYEFTWYNGTTTSDPVIATADATAPVLSELPGGYYTVEVTRTDLFCTSVPVTIEILDVEALPVIGEVLTPSTNCPGGADNGEIEITTIDGVAPGDYTINWYNGDAVKFDGGGARIPDATGVLYSGIPGAATYTVEVINNVTGCINTETYNLPDNSVLPTFSLESDPNSVCDASLASSAFTGEIRVVSLTDPNFEAGQTYTYTYTNTGTATVVTQSAATLSNLEDGTYEVTVANDQLGCLSDPVQVVVDFTPVLPDIVEAFTPSTNCAAADNGAIEITTIDGVVPNADYSINWYDGTVVKFDGLGNRTPDATGAIYSGIPGGANYTVEVINNITGCINTESYTLADIKALPTFSLESDPNAVCNATLGSSAFTGEIRVVSLNDANAEVGHTYTYTFTNTGTGAVVSQATATLSNLEDGTYEVTVENDQLGCLSDPVQVAVGFTPSLPVIVEAFTPSTNCTTADNGAIEITTIDGLAPNADYTINWYNGNSVKFDGGGNRLTDATGAIYAGIPGGAVYTVEVINNITGCVSTESYTLADNSALPTFSLESDPNSVCDEALASSPFTGEIRVVSLTDTNFEAGHTYTYTFTNTGTGAVITQATATLSNLEDGTYEVTVENDQLGCLSDPVQVVVGFTPSLPAIVEAFTPSTNCTTADNGAIEITMIDGVAPNANYTINWYDGNSVKFDGGGNRLTDATGAIYVGIPGGAVYTVEVINNITGCINTESYTLPDNSALPTFSLESDPNSVCDEALASSDFTGEIRVVSLTDVNFVAGHTYTYTFTNTGTGAIVSQSIATLTNLEDGTYEVTVENDQLGCLSDPVQVTVGFTPSLPVIVEAFTPSTNCTAADNGTIEITMIDGAAPNANYTINWYDGNNVKLDGGGNRLPDATGATYAGIPGGANYTVEVINNITGCLNTESYTLADDSELPVVTLSKVDNTICDSGIGFNGSVTASVTYKGSGVTLPDANYVFTWYDGTSTADPVIAVGDNTDEVLAGIEGGFYTVTVNNVALGCTSDPVTIEVVDTRYFPDISIAITPQTYCVGLSGELAATIDESSIGGGNPADPNDYSFTWYEYDNTTNTSTALSVGVVGGVNGESVTQLPEGYYRLEVLRTSTGCINNEIVFLPENITIPDVTLTKVSDLTTCGSPNGALQADVGGVEAGYTFHWYNDSDAVDENFVIANADAVNVDDGSYTGLIPGDYTVVAVNNTTGCISPMQTDRILNATNAISINVNFDILPTDCNTGNGQMTATPTVALTVTDPDTDFTYEWYEGGPINADPVDFFTNPPTFAAPAIASTRTIGGLTSGTFTVVVTYNVTGCSELRTIFLPFIDSPEITATVENSTECPYTSGNGEVTIDIDASGITALPPVGDPSGAIDNDNFTLNFYSGANADVLIAGPTDLDPPTYPANGPVTVATGLAPGFYTIELIEDYTGNNCSVFEVVEVAIDALPPVVSLVGTVSSNTACDLNQADGEFTVDVAKDPDDNAVGTTYTLDISPDPTSSYPIVGQPVGAYSFTQLPPDTYTVTVTASTGCSTTRNFTVPDAPTVSEIVDGDVIITAADLCTPSGSIEITNINLIGVGPDNLDDFEFTWYDDAGLTNIVFQAQGDATAANGGEVLDNVNYVGMGPGTYWVIAQKTTGVGAGCFSAPFQSIVPDVSVDPEISLQAFSNTSCTDLAPEGSITIDVTTASGPGAGGTYTYNITGPAGYNNVLNAQSGVANTVTGLDDGTYTVVATNETTGCSVTGVITVPVNETPIIITAAMATDQELCTPDGRAEVTGVSIDGGVTNRPLNEFEFTWFKDDPNSAPLVDGGAVTITDPFLDITNYLSIEAGTYYVVATRLTGFSPGAGCSSPPARVDIFDVHVNPQISLEPFANTSCNTDFEGSITIDASTPSGPGVGATYTYDITGPNGYATTLNAQTGASNNVPDLEDGTYTVIATNEVTGCTVTGTVTIPKNQTPIIITAAAGIDQELCSPDGRAEVTGVSIDGGVSSRPLGEFEFRWFKDDPNSTALVDGGAITITDPFIDITNYPTIEAGTYYVVAIRLPGNVPGAGCVSPPAKVEILDSHVNPEISLQAFANTSCNADFEGSITINTSTPSGPGVGATYTYDITGPNGYANTLNAQSGVSNNVPNLEDGTYTVIATNEVTSCTVTGTVTILKNETPIIITAAAGTNQELCSPDGRAEVTGVSIDGGATNQPLSEFEFRWFKDDPNSTALVDGGAVTITDPFIDIANYPTIEAGTYYVVAIRLPGNVPGAGCESPPARVDILDSHIDPQIALQGFANTSCTSDYEGSIIIDMTTPSGPGVGATYTYDITGPDGYTNLLNAQTGSANTITSLKEGTYTIIATNEITSCEVTGSITLLTSQTPIIVTSAVAADQQLCTPDGRIDVTGVSIDGGATTRPLNEFEFTWYKDDPASAPLVDGTNAEIKDTFLDISNYPSIEAGVYYVVATRLPGFTPGAGCSSPPARVEIIDSHVNPQVVLSATSNTACDGNFDGTLTINVSDPSGPGVGATYTYDVTHDGNPFVNSAGNSGAGNTLTNLEEGTYVVVATNETTGCTSTATKTIEHKPQPIDVVTVDHEDQDICYPDGRIEVTVTSPTAPANYTYEWYLEDLTSGALTDQFGTIISGPVLEAGTLVGQYPAMGAGTYYVIATRNAANAPGSGCSSPPFRIDVLDISTDPVPTVSFTPNTACDPALANGTVTASVQEQDGSTGDTYTFVWSFEGGALPGTVVQNDVGNTSNLANATEGRYELLITNVSNTGCSVTTSVNVTLDQPQSQPNIIDVATFDPVDCMPTGWAEVQSISIGGGPAITDPVVLNNDFTYRWYEGDVLPANQLADTDTRVDNLLPGQYFVVVTSNITGCESIPKEVNILEEDRILPVIAIEQTVPQINCIGPPFSAELRATAEESDGSVETYVFTWSYEGGGLPPGANVSATTPTSSTLSNLPSGTYEVTAFNPATGCSSSAFFIVKDESERYKPVVSTSSEPLTFCTGDNGSVLLANVRFPDDYPFNVNNYTVDWYNGDSPDLSAAPDYPNTDRVSGLPDGVYTIRVTDNNTGCFVVKLQNIKDERQYPVIEITESSQTTCPPYLPNGVLTATVGGRVGGYSFEWFSGSTAGAQGTGLTTRNKLIGYPAGVYTVRVIDNLTGCSEEETRELQDVHLIPPSPTPELLSNVTSCLEPDGKVTVTVQGETQGYDFLWYEGASVSGSPFSDRINVVGLDVGTYTVTATDVATGCVSDGVPIDVGDDTLRPEFGFETVGSKCDENTGQATIAITNNTVVSTVQWFEVSTGASVGLGTDLNGVGPGEYEALVTTLLGCENTGVVEIGTVITNYNLVSADGDGINDVFQIDCIVNFPNNNVRIYNRTGVLVYEIDGYNNADRAFRGVGEQGLYSMGDKLPNGTYFYLIDKGDGSEIISGFLELIR